MFCPQRKMCCRIASIRTLPNVDAVVLPHPFSGLAKGVLSTKIHYHPLQALRVTAVAHSGALAERPQFGTTSAQPKQLLLQFQRTERGEPSYFFFNVLDAFRVLGPRSLQRILLFGFGPIGEHLASKFLKL